MKTFAGLWSLARGWFDGLPVGPRGRILIRGTSVSLVGLCLLRLAFLARLLTRTRLLSADDVGRYTLATSVVLLLFIASQGFPMGVVRFVSMLYGEPLDEERRRTLESRVKGLVLSLYTVAIPVSLLLTGLSWLLAAPIAVGIFGDETLAPLTRVLSLGLCLSSVTRLNTALLVSRRRVIYHHMAHVCEVLLMVVIVLGAWRWRSGLYVFAYACVAASGIVMALSFVPLKRIMPFLFDRSIPALPCRTPFLRFSLLASLGAVTSRLRADVNTAVVALFLSYADVAVYTVAVRLASLPIILFGALNTILAPVVAELFGARKIDAVKRLHLKTALILLGGGLGFLLVFAVAGRWLLGIFGPVYREAYVPLLVMGVAIVAQCGVGSVATILNMSGRPGWNAFNRAVVLPVFVVACMQLVPRMGIVGAALAFGASRVIMAALGLAEVLVFYRRDKKALSTGDSPRPGSSGTKEGVP